MTHFLALQIARVHSENFLGVLEKYKDGMSGRARERKRRRIK